MTVSLTAGGLPVFITVPGLAVWITVGDSPVFITVAGLAVGITVILTIVEVREEVVKGKREKKNVSRG